MQHISCKCTKYNARACAVVQAIAVDYCSQNTACLKLAKRRRPLDLLMTPPPTPLDRDTIMASRIARPAVEKLAIIGSGNWGTAGETSSPSPQQVFLPWFVTHPCVVMNQNGLRGRVLLVQWRGSWDAMVHSQPQPTETHHVHSPNLTLLRCIFSPLLQLLACRQVLPRHGQSTLQGKPSRTLLWSRMCRYSCSQLPPPPFMWGALSNHCVHTDVGL